MKGSVAKADELGKTIENSVMMRQFDNETGPDIHRRTTAEEIWADTDGQVAALVAGSGTGGTITGTSQRLKELNPKIKSFVVQPAASPLLTGGDAAGHPLAGIGPNFIPSILDTSSYDEVISVENATALTSRGEPPPKRVFWRVYPRELPFGQPAKLQLVQSLRASK